MQSKNILLTAFLICPMGIFAQFVRPLQIPAKVSGNSINLEIRAGNRQFFNGYSTSTIGYNGNHLGPTLVLETGQVVKLNVTNQLGETTTTHWHGLHVKPTDDGGPHTPIVSGATWAPEFKIMDDASTYWYHPHLHGSTLKQVVKGAAGLIIVHDSIERTLHLPVEYGIDDIPLIFQFLTFDNAKQIILADDLDNAVLVNGEIQPFTNIPGQFIRMRILNGSSHRYMMLGLSGNQMFHQIGGDGGFLNSPFALTRLMLGPGERAEILVDFSGKKGQSIFMRQFGTELPASYPGGPSGGMGGAALGPLDNKDFDLLKFTVTEPLPNAITTLPLILKENRPWSLIGASTRSIAITATPMMSMTNFLMNGVKYDENVINFSVNQNVTEIWDITNQSMMPHPFHIHGNPFYILSINGNPPGAGLQGIKDVVTIPPMGGRVRIVTRYEFYADDHTPYMYHCHILSHEDKGMMGQFLVKPVLTGIKAIGIENDIKVYPNPASKWITIELPEMEDSVSLEVYNNVGERVYFTDRLIGVSSKIDVSRLPAGVYILKLEGNTYHRSIKFFKN